MLLIDSLQDVFDPTEIHQLGAAAFQEHDIVRTDITVDQMRFVNVPDPGHNRLKKRDRFIPADTFFPFQVVFQALSVQILHHHVSSIVLLEQIQDMHQPLSVQVLKPCYRTDFQKELLLETADHFRILQQSNFCLLWITEKISCHHAVWKHFLDCHDDFHTEVIAKVNNSESAFSKHLSGQVSSIQNRSERKLPQLV